MDEQNGLVRPKKVSRYFVDEAGDTIFFGSGGKVLLGTDGCSKYFMLGVAGIADPVSVETELTNIRSSLLSDPYFRGVPSMQPEQKKTALFFHAKDDLPEVRREVFKYLADSQIKVHVAIRRKDALVSYARAVQATAPGFRINQDGIYDNLVMHIFHDLLHKADENHIVFARRGKSDRVKSLGTAIAKAKVKFEKKCKKRYDKPTTISAAYPAEQAGLQVIDYHLWALQRFYERGESRFFEMLVNNFCIIRDLDDKRKRKCGAIYCRKRPLGPEMLKAP